MEAAGMNQIPIGFAVLDTPIEIERTFLATMLDKPQWIPRYQHVRPDMIYDPSVAKLWDIALRVVRHAIEGNGDIVAAMLSNDGDLARSLDTGERSFRAVVAEMALLTALTEDHLNSCVTVIIDRWKRRHAISVCQGTINAMHDLEAVEMADEIMQRNVTDLSGLQGSVGVSKSLSVDEICAGLERSESPWRRIETGYDRLDDAMGGGLLAPGITVFEARPKMFKTGTMASVAYRLAQAGTKSSFVTFEMPAREILLRMVAAEGNGNVRSYRKYPDRMRREAAFFRQKYPDMIDFHELHGASFAMLQSTLWQIANSGRKVGFIDYFQLIRGCPRDQSMLDFREDMATWLQGFVNQSGMALVIAAQVGRSGETYGSDALNRNACYVAQIREAVAHNEKSDFRNFWLETRFIRHGESQDIGSDKFGPIRISDVGPMLEIDE